MHSLQARLCQQFSVIEQNVDIAGRTFSMLRPRSADELINEAEFNVDERLPYWAEIWPSERVLADRIGREHGRHRRLLELGCGVGLAAMVAAHRGFDVLATDYYESACDFVRLNARRHELTNIEARMIDWRCLPDDLGKFEWVIAGDVLYERDYCGLVADVIARVLAPGGQVVVTDPGRPRAAAFLDACGDVGLAGRQAARVPFDDGVNTPTIDVYELQWSSER